jgi:hypothetical protein
MRKITLAYALLLVTSAAFAWGATGHRATGWIADQYLSKNAKKHLERILNGQSLAMASTWMDEIKSDSSYDHTHDWHWVTIADGQTYEESAKNPHGDVIQTIERLIAALKSRKLNGLQEQEAVKMLIHLIGDLHQPLHVGAGNDKGGNDIKVSWFRSDSNLHRVWDSDMIDDSRLSYTELAQSLDKPTAAQLSAWQKIAVRSWAYESMTYRKQVYAYGKGRLGYEYTYKNFHIVRHRLLQAGIRIASVLNDIYK